MDIYLKVAQLVHAGDFSQVKKILNNINHPNKMSLEMQCVQSAVSCQRYDMVEYFIANLPSRADTAQFFKIAIRRQDHKMVDLLFKNRPNHKVCSEALMEAIEHDDIQSIKKLTPLSWFPSEPDHYVIRAVHLGCLQSAQYLLGVQPLNSMVGILKAAIHANPTAQQMLDVVMDYATLTDLKEVADQYSRKSNNPLMQRLFAHVDIFTQHQTISAAIAPPQAQIQPNPRKI